MKEFTYTITDEQGIHARPAGLLVKEAAGFASAITIEKDGKKVDAKRILGVTARRNQLLRPAARNACAARQNFLQSFFFHTILLFCG